MLFPSDRYPIFLYIFFFYIAVVIFEIIRDFAKINYHFNGYVDRCADENLSHLESHDVIIRIEYNGDIGLHLEMMETGMENFHLKPRLLKATLEPHSRQTIRYSLVPLERGDFEFKSIVIRINTEKNYIVVQQKIYIYGKIKVFPNIHAIRKYNLAMKHPLRNIGERAINRKGQGSSFKELRDYFPGDEFRRIDWKSTARRDKLTVKEFEDERCQNLMILLDTGRLMTSTVPSSALEFIEKSKAGNGIDVEEYENPDPQVTRLDFAINASVVLSYVALVKGDNVGLMAFDDQLHSYVPPASGIKQMKRIINTLYPILPNLVESDYRSAFVELASQQRKRSLVIFFTDLIDKEASRNLIQYISTLYPTHTILIIAFRDAEIVAQAEKCPDNPDEIYDIAVAKEILFTRELALRELRRKGAMTLDLFPEELSSKVVSEYLKLKARSTI